MTRLYITGEWFLNVDDEGLCKDSWAEGALGFVVQLRNETGQSMALKIPRLLADTGAENAYINELMQLEVSNVFAIMPHEPLLAAEYGNRNVVCGQRSFEREQKPDSDDEPGRVLFFSCAKDTAPRFCAVRCVGSKIDSLPKLKVVDELLGGETWARLEKASENWKQTAFVAQDMSGEKAQKIRVGKLTNALYGAERPVHWYCCPPGITYRWADGTLQEAISKRRLKEWSVSDHLTLIQRLLQGLKLLHDKSFLHGDLRPANVMFVENDPTLPTNYRITDYGSFGTEKGYSSGGAANSLGPSIHRQRTSAFYAPERRHGSENESADTALIFSEPVGEKTKSILIVLGWKNDFLESGRVRPSVTLDVKRYQKQLDALNISDVDSDESILAPGDKIRVREYVFEVKRAFRDDNVYILRCDPSYWLVTHDRFLVSCKDHPSDLPQWLTIPRVVELRQWSAATDLYSVGAIALYSVFRSVDVSEVRRDAQALNDHSAKALLKTPGNSDDDFIEMIDNLESVPYLRDVWFRLAKVLRIFETVYEKRRDTAPIDVPKLEARIFAEGSAGTLYDHLKHEVSYFTRTAPGVFWILVGCKYNLAHFVYFLHFVLRCLHRSASLPDTERATARPPFCKTRTACHESDAQQPATDAVKDVVGIIDRIGDAVFDELNCSDDSERFKLFPYDAAESEYRVRMNNIQFSEAFAEIFSRFENSNAESQKNFVFKRPNYDNVKMYLEELRTNPFFAAVAAKSTESASRSGNEPIDQPDAQSDSPNSRSDGSLTPAS